MNSRAEFFDSIADKWDGWDDLDALGRKLGTGLRDLGLGPSEIVLDVGCGTGNSTRALIDLIGSAGRVVAVDLSPRMIEIAKSKITDPRAEFRCEDAAQITLPDAAVDRVLCFSVWPHFPDRGAVIAEFARVLRPGGRMHIWHLISRDQVNSIHASAAPAVQDDVLLPAEATAAELRAAGFAVTDVVDDATRYLVTAVRPD